MQNKVSPVWIAVIGFPSEGIEALGALLGGGVAGDIPIFENLPLRELVTRPELQSCGAISTASANLATVGKLLDAGHNIRVIALIDDPRRLLIQADGRIPHQYRYGYDHTLDVGENGVATFSSPGLLHNAKLMRSIAGRGGGILTIRHPDLLKSPDKVAAQLKTFLSDGITHFAVEPTGVLPPDLSAAESQRIVRQFRLAPELFDLMKRWHYGAEQNWFELLAASAPTAFEDRPGTIVAYYTRGTRYANEASRMLSSLSRLGLPVALSEVEDAGDWLANVRQKPYFLTRRREELSGPLLYVDVDAIAHSNPWPYLRGYGGDVAVSGHRGMNYISGTILINDTQGARRFLEAWCAAQVASPQAWDQHSMHEVVMTNMHAKNSPFRVDFLPPEMCMVFDRKFSPPIVPVIEHLQASREGRSVDSQPAADAHGRRLARIAQIDVALTLGGDKPALGSDIYRDLKVADRVSRTGQLAQQRKSDVPRWSNRDNLHATWSGRAKIAAAMIAAPGKVLDLGCGNMDLEKHLPRGVVYQPADIVSRDERTIVCDLNMGELPEVEADIVSMLGVMEYIFDPAALLARLAKRWPQLLMTYYPSDLDGGRNRHAHGWFSALTSAGLVATASEAGYDLAAIVPSSDRRERIYMFDSRRCAN